MGIASLRIISDHARAATFLINDGVVPSNEGRGYVLRKILRRGIRHGRLLGQEQPLLCQMVYAVRDLMQGAYPELADSADRVSKVILAEEKQFDRTRENWGKAFRPKALEEPAVFRDYRIYTSEKGHREQTQAMQEYLKAKAQQAA